MPRDVSTSMRLFPLAFAAHVAEEAPGFTAWARRHTSPRYSQRDFVRNNVLGFIGAVAATAVVKHTQRRGPWLAYYTLVVTQQAVFNAVFHAGTTVVFREYSPGLVTSLVNADLWRRMTGAAMAEHRLTKRELRLALLAGGTIHAVVVAQQVFFVGVPERG